MESLVRFLIGFTLFYLTMPMASCKVLRQQGEHEKEITYSEENHGWINETTSPGQLNETSIKQTNQTRTLLSDFNTSSLSRIPEVNRIDSRSLPTLDGVKRSLKRVFFAWTYYGPEVGLCGCLFRYAWFKFPIVPEMSHAMMSRASRMINGFMGDFWHGYADGRQQQTYEKQYNNPEYRISNKVAAMTADDYYDYRAHQVLQNLGPFRRVGGPSSGFSENAPPVEKYDPEVLNAVEMLKTLEPKPNASEFVTRFARHLKSQPQLTSNAQRFRIVSDDGINVRYFIKNRHSLRSKGNATKPAIIVDGRAYGLVPPPLKSDRLGFEDLEPQSGAPHGLPSFNNLPPADFTYFEDGVYHHVHDLRQNKGPHNEKGGGGWIDFEDVILQALGLSQARAAPTMGSCAKGYVLNMILRFFQTSLLG